VHCSLPLPHELIIVIITEETVVVVDIVVVVIKSMVKLTFHCPALVVALGKSSATSVNRLLCAVAVVAVELFHPSSDVDANHARTQHVHARSRTR